MVAPPSRGKVKQAYDLRAENPDMTAYQIGALIGAHESTVYNWLAKPATFSPYYDRVAVLRALAGDGDVFDNLSLAEYKLVIALLERGDSDENPASSRFPVEHREKIRAAIKRRRKQYGQPSKQKHHRIAPTKLTPEVRVRVKEMRQQGIDFAVIAEALDLSKSSVFRALRAAR